MINYRFPPPSDFTAGSTTTRLDIGQNVHVALDDNKGDILVELEDVVRLVFTPGPEAPKWTELGIALNNPQWMECHRIHLRYCAAARQPARMSVALRLFRDTGFEDVFVPSFHDLGPTADVFGADLALSPRMLERVHGCALQLFFDNQENVVELHNLALSGYP